jgi:hypothetical protein
MNSPNFEMSVGIASKEMKTLYKTISAGDKFYTILIDKMNSDPSTVDMELKFLAEDDINRFKCDYTYSNPDLKLWQKKSLEV